MERKVPFIVGEHYHIYTRGVDKRIVCKNEHDYKRLQLLLFLCNAHSSVRMRDLLNKYQGEPLGKIYSEYARGDTLTNIFAYALMPSHLHLLVREKEDGGISQLMLKLMTAYSMYFNIKNERSGPLFTRPFRSRHINSDQYLRWVFAYVHTNPLELYQHDWKQAGLKNTKNAGVFLRTYKYGSFPDYLASGRPESKIIEMELVKKFGLNTVDSLLVELSALPQGFPLGG
jgi:REP element-mobilizing transposase RayT